MVITLDPELEAALIVSARREGLSPEVVALSALRERLIAATPPVQARDEWERNLLGAATDCEVSLPHAAVSSEGMHE